MQTRPKLLIVSEHPSLNEGSKPFTNGFWRYFKAQMRRVGIDPDEVEWANCINQPAASFFSFTQKEKRGSLSGLPALAPRAYLRAEYETELLSLYSHIRNTKPNLVLAVGDLPFMALTHESKLMFARGRITTSIAAAGEVKVLPCWHPRAVMADIKQEPVLFADLAKAKREMGFSEVRRPQRYLHLRPTLEDLEEFWQEFIEPSSHLSIDIETKGAVITCVGIAPTPDRAIVIPFFDEEKPTGNYWSTPREENIAWRFVARALAAEGKKSFGQNFSYDVQYLWRQMGIPSTNWTDDTMLMHHAMQPEMPKGLGFLASIYTDELAWKFMHKRKSTDRSGKKEDV